MRFAVTCTAFLAVFTLAACDDRQSPATSPTAPLGIRASQLGASGVMVTNVTDDTTAQNETPLL